MKRPHLVVDVALCQGCNNCLLACKDEHLDNDWPGYSRPQSRHAEGWISLPCNERGQYPLVDVAYLPTLCAHCADAPCVQRSGGAISKRADGIVLIDPVKAAGRRELVDACPHGMITWSQESAVAQKCTLCAHLLDEGWTEPRCVQACGPGALTFAREGEAAFAARAEAEGLESLHPGGLHFGTVLYKNLGRFASCFIAGSVAAKRDGVVDCAAGAVVSLWKAPGAGTEPGGTERTGGLDECLQTTQADVFGDFKFDGLEPDSGGYVVEVDSGGQGLVRVTAVLGLSVTLGTIMLGSVR
jgi:Fe-S-cluster-containing dehydrogenase component